MVFVFFRIFDAMKHKQFLMSNQKQESMKKEFLTIGQFASLLMTIKLSAFAQVQSVTEPKLNKKNRETGEPMPFKTVLNCRNLNVQLNYNYENQIIHREEKEGAENGSFEASEHSWARPLSEGALATRKSIEENDVKLIAPDFLYMPYVKVRVDSQKYIADGREIDKAEIVPFMPPKSDYENQPIENKVRVEYMKLRSIKTFIYNGTEYQIIG